MGSTTCGGLDCLIIRDVVGMCQRQFTHLQTEILMNYCSSLSYPSSAHLIHVYTVCYEDLYDGQTQGYGFFFTLPLLPNKLPFSLHFIFPLTHPSLDTPTS